MSRWATVLGLAAGVLLVTAACASAQATASLAERIGPAGMHRVAVRAPDDPRLPVRLSFADHPQARAQVWVDVLVTPSTEDASQRGEALAAQVAAGLPARQGLGDRAWGDGGMVVLVRGVVVASVRVLSGDHDVARLAQHVDAALAGAATPRGWDPRARIEPAQRAGAPRRVILEGEAVAAHVRATGGGYARRGTDGGWVIVGTGSGPTTVRAVVVGPDLQVRELVLTP